jgi:hypothetical protein
MVDRSVLDRLLLKDAGWKNGSTNGVTRRQVLQTGAIAGAATVIPAESPPLEVSLDKDVLLVRLGPHSWTLSANWFAGHPEIGLQNIANGYRLWLRRARFAGLAIHADFEAVLHKVAWEWRLSGTFHDLGIKFDTDLSSWLAKQAPIRGKTYAAIAAPNSLPLLNVASAKRQYDVTIDPSFTFHFSCSSSPVSFLQDAVRIDTDSFRIRALLPNEASAIDAFGIARRGVGALIDLRSAQSGGSALSTVLGQNDAGRPIRLSFAQAERIELALAEVRSGCDSSLLIAGPSGLACPGEADFSRALKFDKSVYVAQLAPRSEAGFAGYVSEHPHLVAMNGGAVTVAADQDGPPVIAESKDGRITTFDAVVRLHELFAPIVDADSARFAFKDESLRLVLQSSDPSRPQIEESAYRPIPDRLPLLPIAAHPTPRPQPLPTQSTLAFDSDAYAFIRLDRASLRLFRSGDLLDLRYEFINLAYAVQGGKRRLVYQPGAGARLQPETVGARMVVHFPRQHVVERAYFRQIETTAQQTVRPNVDIASNDRQSVGADERSSAGSAYVAFKDKFKTVNGVEYDPKTATKAQIDKAWNALANDAKSARDPDFASFRAAYNQVAGKEYDPTDSAITPKNINDTYAKMPGANPPSDPQEPFLDVTDARISGPSRLVFDLSPIKNDPLPLTVDALTSWSNFALVVAPRALPRNVSIEDQLTLIGIDKNTRLGDKLAKVVTSLVPPAPAETAIEVPYRVVLSPASTARWLRLGRSPPPPDRPDDPWTLWHTRLDPQNGADTVRAIWSPDLDREIFFQKNLVFCTDHPQHSNEAPWPDPTAGAWTPTPSTSSKVPACPADPVQTFKPASMRMSLDIHDRHELVLLSSTFGMPALLPLLPLAQLVGSKQNLKPDTPVTVGSNKTIIISNTSDTTKGATITSSGSVKVQDILDAVNNGLGLTIAARLTSYGALEFDALADKTVIGIGGTASAQELANFGLVAGVTPQPIASADMPKSSVFPLPTGFTPDSLPDPSDPKNPQGPATIEGLFVPQPLEQADIIMTTLGASINLLGRWEPPASYRELWPALTVERWRHNTTLGRDVFVEVLYKGFLFPIGHRASLVKLTERRFYTRAGQTYGEPTAYLIQRMFILIGRPEKQFPALFQAFGGRGFPVQNFSILTKRTPDIVDPYDTSSDPPTPVTITEKVAKHHGGIAPLGGDGTAFWPRVATDLGNEVQFTVSIDGSDVPLVMPMVFVDNTAVHDQASVASLVDYYNNTLPTLAKAADDAKEPGLVSLITGLRTATAGDVKRSYAKKSTQKPAQTSNSSRTQTQTQPSSANSEAKEAAYVSHAWRFKAHGRLATDANGKPIERFDVDGFLEGADQPPFYPIVDEADVTVQTLDHLLGAGRGKTTVGFDTTYLNRGFDLSANPSEIYLRVIKPSIQLDASSSGQSVGGLAKPNTRIVALSRSRGLVGGNPQSGTSGKPPRAAGLASILTAPATPPPPGPPPAPSPSPSSSPLLNPGRGLGDTPAAAAGRFDAAEFFGGALSGAKLLGLISLKDLIKVTDFAKAPQLQEQTQYGSPDDKNDSNSGIDLTGTIKALKDVAADAAKSIKEIIDKAQTAVQSAICGTDTGCTGPDVKTLYPDLVNALNNLSTAVDAALTEANSQSPNLTSLIQDTTTVVATAQQALTAMQAVENNPVPANLRNVIAEITGYAQQITTAVTGAQSAITDIIAGAVAKADSAFLKAVQQLFCTKVSAFTGLVFGRTLSKSDCDNLTANPRTALPAILVENSEALLNDTVAAPLRDAVTSALALLDAKAEEFEQQAIDTALKTVNAAIPLSEIVAVSNVLIKTKNDPAYWANLILPLLGNFIDQLVPAPDALVDEVQTIQTAVLQFQDYAKYPAVESARAKLTMALEALSRTLTGLEVQRAQLCGRDPNNLNESQFNRIFNVSVKDVSSDLPSKLNAVQNAVTLRAQAVKQSIDLVSAAVDTLVVIAADAVPDATGKPPQQFGDAAKALVPALAKNLLPAASKLISDVSSLSAVVSAVVPAADATKPWSVFRKSVEDSLQAQFKTTVPSYYNRLGGEFTDLEGSAKSVNDNLNNIATPDFTKAYNDFEAGATQTTLAALRDKALVLNNALAPTVAYVTGTERALLGAMAFGIDLENDIITQIGNLVTGLAGPAIAAIAKLYDLLQDSVTKTEDYVKSLGPAELAKLTADDPKLWLAKLLRPDRVQQLAKALADYDTENGHIQDLAKALSPAAPPVNFADVASNAQTVAGDWQPKNAAPIELASLLNDVVTSLARGNLANIFDFGALQGLLTSLAQSFLPTKVHLQYDWGTQLEYFPSDSNTVFAMLSGPSSDDLTLHVSAEFDLLTNAPSNFEVTGNLKPFRVNLLSADRPDGTGDVMSINFGPATFGSSNSSGADFHVDVTKVELGTDLEFIQALEGIMGDSGGLVVTPTIMPPGISISYTYSSPPILIGTMLLSNVAFGVGCDLPFDVRNAQFWFNFAQRSLPFLIYIPPYYGGGGFASILLDTSDIVGLEAAFEFGAYVPVDFGPLSGDGRVMAGIYVSKTPEGGVIAGFVEAVGEGHLGCFGLSFCLSVWVQQVNGNVTGSATFTFTFSFGLGDISFSVGASYTYQGSGSSSGGAGVSAQFTKVLPKRQPVSDIKYVIHNDSATRTKNIKKYFSQFALEA